MGFKDLHKHSLFFTVAFDSCSRNKSCLRDYRTYSMHTNIPSLARRIRHLLCVSHNYIYIYDNNPTVTYQPGKTIRNTEIKY